jgi:hypothetical protein
MKSSPDVTSVGKGRKQLLLIELNEVNFDVAQRYVGPLRLRHIDRLLQGHAIRTRSEASYEQLEPWIQWVSAHSGLTAEQHGVFRLGDIVGSNVPQVFEQLEAAGLSVGCVSAMNAENRLRAPAYFIPDPWTKTPSDGSFWSRSLGDAISQAVNDNANGRINARSAGVLGLALLRFANPRHWPLYAKLSFASAGAPWRKALFLDLLLHDVHASLMRFHRPDFSTLFLNAGAHIQHHYFFNARTDNPRKSISNPEWYVSAHVDPFAEMLQVYDAILGGYMDRPGVDLIVATGLTQQPYDRVKYYYRLKDHRTFLQRIGMDFTEVHPRMTRDFLVEFASSEQADAGERLLQAVRHQATGQRIFGEIHNRGRSLFVTLTWPDEISSDFEIEYPLGSMALHPCVVFVAIKNGMHLGEGFAFFSGASTAHAPANGAHVSSLYGVIRGFFGLPADRTAT